MVKLFIHDFTYSLSYGKYKYLAFFGIVALLVVAKSLEAKPVSSNSVVVFFNLMQDNGYIKSLAEYQVPIYWIFVQCFTLFLISDFLNHDMERNRVYLVLRVRPKISYILSKVIWIVAQNILLFVGIFVVIYMISSFVLGNFSLGSTPYYKEVIAPQFTVGTSPTMLILRLFVGFIITSIALSGLLLLGIQWIPAIAAFLGIIIVSAISTFSGLKWLPAIHSMILRQEIFNLTHHLTLRFSLMYSVVLFVVCVILTTFIFKRKDIY
ncbi:hypothetical protein ACFO4N_14845 [Camelliibacillus cellulosilyticus]|uniref:ABC-2 type transport system permease protein n=1 Tax=Camelliibacillus cellulosilyticus TaxID=2174486 RepID=A0ABV9GQZ9_9BACL